MFKVQTTEAGCLSPEAVIDRLTKERESERETEQRWEEERARARQRKTPGELV